MRDFPLIDLLDFQAAPPSAKRDIGRQVDEICRQTGFLAIAGHGIPDQVIAGAWSASRTFFDLRAESKLEVSMPYVGYPYGYSPLQAEALANSLGEETPPDIKESFSIGPLEHRPIPGTSPTRIFALLQTCGRKSPRISAKPGRILSGDGELAARIMRVFAAALSLSEIFFDGVIDNPISAMRALNYPNQPYRRSRANCARVRIAIMAV